MLKPFYTYAQFPKDWTEFNDKVIWYLENGYQMVGPPTVDWTHTKQIDGGLMPFVIAFFIKEDFALQMKKAINGGNDGSV